MIISRNSCAACSSMDGLRMILLSSLCFSLRPSPKYFIHLLLLFRRFVSYCHLCCAMDYLAIPYSRAGQEAPWPFQSFPLLSAHSLCCRLTPRRFRFYFLQVSRISLQGCLSGRNPAHPLSEMPAIRPSRQGCAREQSLSGRPGKSLLRFAEKTVGIRENSCCRIPDPADRKFFINYFEYHIFMPLSEKYAVLLFSVYQKRAAFTNPILLISGHLSTKHIDRGPASRVL